MSDRYSEDLSELAEAAKRALNQDASMPCYGADYENAVFAMRPFCWADCDCGYEKREADWYDANPHAPDCYYPAVQAIPYSIPKEARDRRIQALCEQHGIPWRGGWGCMVHCTCGQRERAEAWEAANGHAADCCIQVPNFLHKPSGLEVRWYKYIGRDMEYSRQPPRAEWNRIMDECHASIGVAA